MRYFDLSHKIEGGMPVYPGDEGVSLLQTRKLETDHYNAWSLTTGMHSGTHIDCPLHLLESAGTTADYRLEGFSGRGCLIDARGDNSLGYKPEYERVRPGDIVLILTGMDRVYGSEGYYNEHPVVSEELGHFLASRDIRMLGMDMPSPDRSPFPVHKLLLDKGIFILENLTGLEQLIGLEDFEVFAVPLKICAEASLTRAFARCP